MTTMSPSLPFDTVVLTEDTGEHRMDAHSFLALPLHKRVRLILERRVALYLKDRPVSIASALKSVQVKEALERLRKD